MSVSVSDSASSGVVITSGIFGLFALCDGVYEFFFTKTGHPNDAAWLVLIVPIALFYGAIVGGALFALVGGVAAASRGKIVPGPISYAVMAAVTWRVVLAPLAAAWFRYKSGLPASFITLGLVLLPLSGFLVGWRLKRQANESAKPVRDPFNSVGRRLG
ncbi:MAG: hypothetical protein WB816_19755 [Methylocystis sp.]